MVLLILMIIVGVFAFVVPMFFIFEKAGMSPLFAFLMFIPGLGFLFCLSILAFGKWNLEALEGV